jgi:hypothetical protein
VIERQEQFHEHDDLEFQRLLTKECDLSQAHDALLAIGYGPGYWLCEMARAYPLAQ